MTYSYQFLDWLWLNASQQDVDLDNGFSKVFAWIIHHDVHVFQDTARIKLVS